jgi:hypothetical protein
VRLTKVRIQNFRCFREEVAVDVSGAPHQFDPNVSSEISDTGSGGRQAPRIAGSGGRPCRFSEPAAPFLEFPTSRGQASGSRGQARSGGTGSPIKPLAFSTARNARSWSKCPVSGPTHRAVVRRRRAGGPLGGGGRLPSVRAMLGLVLESGFGPQRMGTCEPAALISSSSATTRQAGTCGGLESAGARAQPNEWLPQMALRAASQPSGGRTGRARGEGGCGEFGGRAA